jgi:hypothetical protein
MLLQLGVTLGLSFLIFKNKLLINYLKEPCSYMDSLAKLPKLLNMYTRIGTWNVRSLNRTGSLMENWGQTNIMKVGQKCHQSSRLIFIYIWKGNVDHESCTRFSVVNRDKFANDRILRIILRGRWCHIIFLNVQAPTEGKIHDMDDCFHEELECGFNKFPIRYIKIVLGEFSGKVSMEDIFKTTIWNVSLH